MKKHQNNNDENIQRHNIKFDLRDEKQKTAAYVMAKAYRKQTKFIAFLIDDYLRRLGIDDIENVSDKEMEIVLMTENETSKFFESQVAMNQFLLSMQRQQKTGDGITTVLPNFMNRVSAPGTTIPSVIINQPVEDILNKETAEANTEVLELAKSTMTINQHIEDVFEKKDEKENISAPGTTFSPDDTSSDLYEADAFDEEDDDEEGINPQLLSGLEMFNS